MEDNNSKRMRGRTRGRARGGRTRGRARGRTKKPVKVNGYLFLYITGEIKMSIDM